ncbi:Uncharacterized protein FWK35_00032634, partial [Aphis craccivora]
MLMRILLCCVIVVFCICTMAVASLAKTKKERPAERGSCRTSISVESPIPVVPPNNQLTAYKSS